MISIDGRLEIHLTHDCNLRCVGCNHFSNVTTGGLVDPADFRRQLEPWSQRIVPKGLSLLGGEPTLNPHLSIIIQLARAMLPSVPLMLVTNGLLLHEHAGLPHILKDSRVFVLISLHADPKKNTEQAQLLQLISKWRSLGISISSSPSWDNWIESFSGRGPLMIPTGNGDAFSAWNSCPAAQHKCFQLMDGLIWKCPLVAYLPLVKKKFPLLSSRWDPALSYQALKPSATDDEIVEFFRRREEDVCGLCPSSDLPQTC